MEFRKTRLEGARQTAESIGDDFHAWRRCVKHLVVGDEAVEVETFDETTHTGDVVANYRQERRGRSQTA
jgi:hypothetical protein